MIKIRKYLLTLIALVAVLFFAIFPYNKYCTKTGSCNPIYLKSLFQKPGLNFNIKIATQNYHERIEFKLISKETFATKTNEVIIAEFEVKNKYNKIVYFRPMLVVEPSQFLPYVERYQCLCQEQQSVRAKETKRLKAVFAIKNEIEEDPLFFEKYYVDDSLTEDSSFGNFFPEPIEVKYIIQNSY